MDRYRRYRERDVFESECLTLMSRCLAVMYHYVRDRGKSPESGIRGLDVGTFERQLDVLQGAMTPIDWPALVAWRTGRVRVDEPTFLLTFDDGLSDHAEVVAPILESRGLRGVFFVGTGTLTGRVPATAHMVHLLLCHVAVDELMAAVRARAIEAGVELAGATKSDGGVAKKIYAYETPERAELKWFLTYGLPIGLRDEIVGSLFAERVGDVGEFASRWYMNWESVSHLECSGHTIGGHGHVHEPLMRLTEVEQSRDMGRCAAVLREGLGPGVRPFSYPFGSVDGKIARRCGDCGFVNGFTTQRGWIEASGDAHRLSRVDTIHVDSFLEKELACLRQ